jgi:Peptidase family S41/N-terminal domain of Peptidase_S41 in eukaryotic IRBP
VSPRLILVTIVFSVIRVAVAETSTPPVIPETRAGQALGLWLDSFNRGERACIESFRNAHASWVDLDWLMKARAVTGGYDLLAIESSQQTDIIFRMKERVSANETIGRIQVTASEPLEVTELGLFLIPAGAKFQAVALGAAARAALIDSVARVLDEAYVFPNTAREMVAGVRGREKRGEYDGIVDGEEFARRLTGDLQDISHDKHVEVRFSFVVQPANMFTMHAENDPTLRRQLLASNCGFEKAEHLPPNIGYLKFNMFADPEICAAAATTALTSLADSDALILDLRDNNGGMSGMVTWIASYLFDVPTHLEDAYDRTANTTKEFWTSPSVPGKKFIRKPVFVLTSKATFSAAEAFSYALKNLKRATLIGETTGGGAHPVQPHRIDDNFSIIVPFARSVSPITKTDWEGAGVDPDVKVPAKDALAEALKRARHGLQAAEQR